MYGVPSGATENSLLAPHDQPSGYYANSKTTASISNNFSLLFHRIVLEAKKLHAFKSDYVHGEQRRKLCNP